MRILVTVKPRMYRESLALSLHQHNPDFEVILGEMESLDAQAESFRPHLLIRNDTDGVDMELRTGAVCWVEILYSDGMDARITLDGDVWEIEDISTEDLLRVVDKTEKMIARGAAG